MAPQNNPQGPGSTIPNPQDRDLDDPGRPGGSGSWGPGAHPGEPGSADESEDAGIPWAPPSEATPPYALPGAPPDAGPGWLPPADFTPQIPRGVSPGIWPGMHPYDEATPGSGQMPGAYQPNPQQPGMPISVQPGVHARPQPAGQQWPYEQPGAPPTQPPVKPF